MFELTASAVRRLATGKIDGSSEPSSSLVACRALRAPAYVNTDYGLKASLSTGYKWMRWCAWPRPQQEWSELVRRVTFVATKKDPTSIVGSRSLRINILPPA